MSAPVCPHCGTAVAPEQLGLTPRLRDAKTFIAAYVVKNATSPTYAEIATALGHKSRSMAFQVVEALVARGHAVRGRGARSISLIGGV